MTAGRFTGSHARGVEVRRQMLPFRFGLLAAVAPTVSAWRDQARTAEDLDYSTLYASGYSRIRTTAAGGLTRHVVRWRSARDQI
jgi:hypothetical protein